MSKKPGHSIESNRLLALKLKDSQSNLEEFTRVLASKVDLNCFDILSITRVDSDLKYQQTMTHRKATRSITNTPTSTKTGQVITLPVKRFR